MFPFFGSGKVSAVSVLVTGVAGFIGSHVAHALLNRGDRVIGLDDLCDTQAGVLDLKNYRLSKLQNYPGFEFVRVDVSDRDHLENCLPLYRSIDRIVHLAARTGVRQSLLDPSAYANVNVTGHVNVLEFARKLPSLFHFVYASSSSVYGHNSTVPFAAHHRVDRPASLYAATKRSAELVSSCYSELFDIPSTGLRFFTVYGPWGRPDMAPWLFATAIFEGTPIKMFNHGKMKRDFTYIDDIVSGVLLALDRPPRGNPRHVLYNFGNEQSETLSRFVEVLENATARKACREYVGMQAGDVVETFADITSARSDLGYSPKTTIDEGIPIFVEWFRQYHGLK